MRELPATALREIYFSFGVVNSNIICHSSGCGLWVLVPKVVRSQYLAKNRCRQQARETRMQIVEQVEWQSLYFLHGAYTYHCRIKCTLANA